MGPRAWSGVGLGAVHVGLSGSPGAWGGRVKTTFHCVGDGMASCLSFSSMPLSLPRLPLPVVECLSHLPLSVLLSFW